MPVSKTGISVPTILDSDAALKAGLERLVAIDATMARLVAEGAKPALRKRPAGFEGLAWIIVGQQLSTASAGAIWSRLKESLETVSPDHLLAAREEALRAAGLSASKIRTLRGLSRHVHEGRLALDDLERLPAEQAHALLTAVKGIGPWTADVYLLFCLGHPDAFPSGDLALQEATRLALALDRRPDAKDLGALSQRWRPWRGVAAKVLWAYYRTSKSREGAPV
jgi:DNA-3-methyladenine glycosylase II